MFYIKFKGQICHLKPEVQTLQIFNYFEFLSFRNLVLIFVETAWMLVCRNTRYFAWILCLHVWDLCEISQIQVKTINKMFFDFRTSLVLWNCFDRICWWDLAWTPSLCDVRSTGQPRPVNWTSTKSLRVPRFQPPEPPILP